MRKKKKLTIYYSSEKEKKSGQRKLVWLLRMAIVTTRCASRGAHDRVLNGLVEENIKHQSLDMQKLRQCKLASNSGRPSPSFLSIFLNRKDSRDRVGGVGMVCLMITTWELSNFSRTDRESCCCCCCNIWKIDRTFLGNSEFLVFHDMFMSPY